MIIPVPRDLMGLAPLRHEGVAVRYDQQWRGPEDIFGHDWYFEYLIQYKAALAERE